MAVSKRDKKKRSQKEQEEAVATGNLKESSLQIGSRLEVDHDVTTAALPQRSKREKVSPRSGKAKVCMVIQCCFFLSFFFCKTALLLLLMQLKRATVG